MPAPRRSSIATSGVSATYAFEFALGEDKSRSKSPSPFEDSSPKNRGRLDLSGGRHRATRRASLGGSQTNGALQVNSYHGESPVSTETPPSLLRNRSSGGRRRPSMGGTMVEAGTPTESRSSGRRRPSMGGMMAEAGGPNTESSRSLRRVASGTSPRAPAAVVAASVEEGDQLKVKRLLSRDKQGSTRISTVGRKIRSTSTSRTPVKRSPKADKQPSGENPKKTSAGCRRTASKESNSKPESHAVTDPNERWTCECGHKMRMCMNFCGMCAAPKHWTCQSCDFNENACDFKYCGRCASAKAGPRSHSETRPPSSDSSTEPSTCESTHGQDVSHDSVLLRALEYESCL